MDEGVVVQNKPSTSWGPQFDFSRPIWGIHRYFQSQIVKRLVMSKLWNGSLHFNLHNGWGYVDTTNPWSRICGVCETIVIVCEWLFWDDLTMEITMETRDWFGGFLLEWIGPHPWMHVVYTGAPFIDDGWVLYGSSIGNACFWWVRKWALSNFSSMCTLVLQVLLFILAM